jgi:AcrR family transcriptional regulator
MSSQVTGGKVDPRILRTRSLLSQAFLDAMQEKGFQAVSVQDITRRAGVNRTTFYLHFADKYALVQHSISQSFRGEIEKRMLNACRFSLENLRSLIVAVGEFILFASAHCASPDGQFEALVETQVKQQVQELLEVWLDLAPSAGKTATAASWAVYGLALQWSREKKRPPVEVFASETLPLIAAILGQAQQRAQDRAGQFIQAFTAWAAGQNDIQALALVGSHARGEARPDSDVDLVVIAAQPERYLRDSAWVAQFGEERRRQVEDYGALTSLRIWYADGLEVEYGLTGAWWAAEPLDAGTREVMRGGIRVLFERGEMLSRHRGVEGVRFFPAG